MDPQDPVKPTHAADPLPGRPPRVTRSIDEWPFATSNVDLDRPVPWTIRAAHAARWVPETDPTTRIALDRLGRELAQLCAARGLSQRRLAASSGVSQATISRLMRGMTPRTRLSTVARILAALDGHVADTASVGSAPLGG